jgi:hypothetical protein
MRLHAYVVRLYIIAIYDLDSIPVPLARVMKWISTQTIQCE